MIATMNKNQRLSQEVKQQEYATKNYHDYQ